MRSAIYKKEKEKSTHNPSFFRKEGKGFFKLSSNSTDQKKIQRKEKRDYSEGFVDDEDQMYQSPIQMRGEKNNMSSERKSNDGFLQMLTQAPFEMVSKQGFLNAAQEASAIRYNRIRYNSMSAQIIQNVVGTTADGIIGRLTVEAIASYQSTNGLLIDGKVGEQTLRSMVPDMEARSEHNEAIRLLMDFYNMSDFGALLSISFDPSLTTANATTSGSIPGPSTVRIGPLAFAQGFAGLVHTIKHELEHVRQRKIGIMNRDVREFLGEAVEIISLGMPEESVAGFFSDARRALRHFNRLSNAEKRTHWARFVQVRNKVRARFAAATAAEQVTHQPTLDGYNAVVRP